jgi:hypothetical protein
MTIAAIAGLSTVTAGAAHAGGLVSHKVPGAQGGVACLSAKVCVGYGFTEKSVGDVVELHNGVSGHISVIGGTQGVSDVSCPTSKGCVAIDRTGNDVGTELSMINRAGKVTRSVHITTKLSLGFIACRSLTSCEVAGLDGLVAPATIQIGSWNGHKLSGFHTMKPIHGANSTSLSGFWCGSTSCVLAGNEQGDKLAETGVVITARDGHQGVLHRVKGKEIDGISCATPSRCYAVGANVASPSESTVVLTLVGGSVTHTATLAGTAHLDTIACHGVVCTAGGVDNAPSGSPSGVFYNGVIEAVKSGVPGTPALVAASSDYSGMAQVTGGRFIAIGAGQGGFSEATTG